MDYSKKKYKKKYNAQEVLHKLEHYCAYQERCHYEVRSKILGYEIYGDELEEIISSLIEKDFLNEERYAMAYVSGKFKINKWGKHKILHGLKQKKISDYCINVAMRVIPSDRYNEILLELLQKKNKTLTTANPYELKQKLFRYAIQKGYHSEDINRALSKLVD